jgi:catechol 2,3-dioxygenase-like lactoylglutathione lyase family enzyme
VTTAILAFLLAAGAGDPERIELQPYLAGVSVADVAVSAKWYEAKLGFETYRRMDLPEHGLKIVFLRSGSFRLELVQKAGAVPLTRLDPTLTDDTRVLGLKKLAFAVSDIDGVAARLRSQGVRFLVEPFNDEPMKLRSFVVADPDGNALQFVQETK